MNTNLLSNQKLCALLFACFSLLPLISLAQYQSSNISQLGHWDNPSIDSITDFANQRYSGCYGWTDTLKNKRYAILGGTDGTYFIEITQPSNPQLRDFVAGALDSCTWREYKTFGHYAYLASDDSEDNRFQIVDLSYLPDSVKLIHDTDTLIRRSHTIYIDGDKLYCGGVSYIDTTTAMAVYSLANPEQPQLLRKLEQDYPWIDYVHDMFVRNDTIYASAGFQGLFIFKFQGDTQFVMIGQYTLYPDQGFNHSSYLTEDGRYLVFTDEVPEGLNFKVIDVSDLSNISLVQTMNTSPGATPHNPYIRNGILYMAAYQDGLHMYDLNNNGMPEKLGYFDTFWQNDSGGFIDPDYAGCWGAWPFPEDNLLIASDMQNGLFILDISQALSNQRDLRGDNSPEVLLENPGSGDIEIEFSEQIPESLQVFTLEGKLVYQLQPEGKKVTISESYLGGSGVYLIRMEYGDESQTIRYLQFR
jgi:choice-of-anchor B domain-containing protein